MRNARQFRSGNVGRVVVKSMWVMECGSDLKERSWTTNRGTHCRNLADPKISLASAASMFLGGCAAAAVGPLDWGWLALTVIGIFAIEVAKNASGEIFDFDSGADLAVAPKGRTPFSGGKRVLVEGLLTREQTWFIAALGVGLGLSIALWRAPAVLGIGIAGVVLAYQYHAPPLKLSYRGWGEFAVALCYGPLKVRAGARPVSEQGRTR